MLIGTYIWLLRLQLLVGRRGQTSLRQWQQHLRRCIHRHDDGVVVAGAEASTDLLDVVQALRGAAAARSGRDLRPVTCHRLDRLALVQVGVIVWGGADLEALRIVAGGPAPLNFLVHFHK